MAERVRRHWPALALCVVSAVVAVVVKHTVFPLLSFNNDEAVYRLQADAIAHGHLFPPTPALHDSFRPWLGAVSGGHYVLKYSLALPSLMAVSQLLVGSFDLYLAAVGAGVAGATYLLALELLDDRRHALVAAGLVVGSPVVLLHSALLLPYLPTMLFLELFAWALVRGTRRRSALLVAVSGLAIGMAFNIRPYDAALFGAPWVAYAVWRRPGVRQVLAFLAPTGAALAVFLILNQLTTSHPLRPPFAFIEPADAFGFGERRQQPFERLRTFSIFEAVEGSVAHGRMLLYWLCGGPLLVVLAVAGWRHLRRAEARVLLIAAIAVPVGYFVFWAPWNATVVWGGARFLGPYYYVVVLVPAAVLAARGLGVLGTRSRLATTVVASLLVAVTLIVATVVTGHHLRITRDQKAIAAMLHDAPPRPKIVFTQPSQFLMNPVAFAGNDSTLTGETIYAVQRGAGDLDVQRMFRDRDAYLLTLGGDFTDSRRGASGRLRPLEHVTGPDVRGRVLVRFPKGVWNVELEVQAFGQARTYRLPYHRGRRYEHFSVTTDGARLVGRTPYTQYTPRVVRLDPSAPVVPAVDRGLVITLYLGPLDGSSRPRAIARDRVPLRRTADRIEALLPTGRGWSTRNLKLRLLEASAEPTR
ncbi:MAG TPA: glycosyltransferase family 39 protein [Acidimicrobiales bacterium]|nr:glycosyltransferase family 39 protein [Acidimicrobiales bacterium]